MTLTTKVLVAMGLGIIVGLVINLSGLNSEGSFTQEYVVGGALLYHRKDVHHCTQDACCTFGFFLTHLGSTWHRRYTKVGECRS